MLTILSQCSIYVYEYYIAIILESNAEGENNHFAKHLTTYCCHMRAKFIRLDAKTLGTLSQAGYHGTLNEH